MTQKKADYPSPFLSIGCAHFDDYDGLVFTVQALSLYHDTSDCELIVVDNSPHSSAGKSIKDFMTKIGNSWHKVTYVEMKTNTGTTQPRQRVFDLAVGEAVMCMDCHVLLAQGALEDLIDFYKSNPDNKDILSGPLIYDDLQSVSTHFDPVWRSEMYGVWATDPRGLDPLAEPFEIPGQGLGVFTCRRSAWLGFNPHFTGFGGEELYIHEKFRQAGHKALCLPFLRWWHRFGRPGGVKYPIQRWNKVRNYVLGHLELGKPLDDIHGHFVGGHLMSQQDWDHLVKDPVAHNSPHFNRNKASSPAKGKYQKPQQQQVQPVYKEPETIDELFDWVKRTPRDLNEHADKVREIASAASHITAFVKRREWNILLAAAKPRVLTVYQLEGDAVLDKVHEACQAENIVGKYTSVVGPGADSLLIDVEQLEDMDLLVLDTVMSAERLGLELEKFGHLARRILVRGTGAFGMYAEGVPNAPGLFEAMRVWMEENPEWFIKDHVVHQYGMTLMSRVEAERPAIKLQIWPPGYGPGTELKALWMSLGIAEQQNCDCNARAQQMDFWGVQGCKDNKETIIKWLQEGQSKWGWKDKIAAAAKAVTSGLAFKLNPLDPFRSIVEEAIQRASEKEKVNERETEV